MRPPVLFQVRDLRFAYDRIPRLHCPEMDLVEGVTAGLVGPNGSGKTTLLKLLNGLLGPYTGSICFAGQPLTASRELRRRTVYVHQHPVLFAGSVSANLEYVLQLRSLRRAERQERVGRIAERFGLTGLLGRDATRLSGGETQRVALARALVGGADTLLLDEPTASVDAESDMAIRQQLLELKAEGYTIIFSAHDAGLVRLLADECWHFTEGSPERADPARLEVQQCYN